MDASSEAAAKVAAFALGLRRKTLAGAGRWRSWPRGDAHLAAAVAAIDAAARRATAAGGGDVAAATADLRALLEWTTYQSGALTAARALRIARRTRMFVATFRLLPEDAPVLAQLATGEAALRETIATRNGYLTAIAARHPHLALPPPLAGAGS